DDDEIVAALGGKLGQDGRRRSAPRTRLDRHAAGCQSLRRAVEYPADLRGYPAQIVRASRRPNAEPDRCLIHRMDQMNLRLVIGGEIPCDEPYGAERVSRVVETDQYPHIPRIPGGRRQRIRRRYLAIHRLSIRLSSLG